MWNSKVLVPGISALPAVAIFLTIEVTPAAGDSDCASLAASANCSFYCLCIEAVTPCGPAGYAEGYGQKYCQRFGKPDYNDLFNEKVSIAIVINCTKGRFPYINFSHVCF